MDEAKVYGSVIGKVTGASQAKGQAVVEDGAGHEVVVKATPEQLEVLGNRFGRLVLVTGEAVFAKSGRLSSVTAATVAGWEPMQVVDLPAVGD